MIFLHVNNKQMYYSNFSSLIAILSLILFSFSSCSKEVTLDTGEEVVVVECILSCDSIQHLNLAYTHPKSQKTDTQVISEAQVTLFDETANSTAGAFHFLNDSWTLSYSAIRRIAGASESTIPADMATSRRFRPEHT